MRIDKIEGFHILEHFEIRVVRSGYVDSVEAAIAFATRRDAKDPREVPILLRMVTRGGADVAGSATGPLKDEKAIRDAYGRLTAKFDPTEHRVLAQEAIERGIDFSIAGRVDQKIGSRVVALSRAEFSLERMVPLTQDAATALVEHFHPFNHPIKPEHLRRMLEHVLLRVSELYEDPDVESFVLNPVRLHENEYTVLDADIEARRPLHLKERLPHHAHDLKEYGYRPAGRQ